MKTLTHVRAGLIFYKCLQICFVLFFFLMSLAAYEVSVQFEEKNTIIERLSKKNDSILFQQCKNLLYLNKQKELIEQQELDINWLRFKLKNSDIMPSDTLNREFINELEKD